MKITNPLTKSVTLKWNAKIADVSPCVAVEDLNINQGFCARADVKTDMKSKTAASQADLKVRLRKVGLRDLDVDYCQASPLFKQKLVELIEQFEDIFSRHSLDCGKGVYSSHSFDG